MTTDHTSLKEAAESADIEIDFDHIKSVAKAAQAEESDWVTFHPLEVLSVLAENEALREHVKQGLHAVRAAGNAVEYEWRSFETKAAQEEAYVRAWEIRARALTEKQS